MSRLISEDAVIALVNGKIDALKEKITRTNEKPRDASTDTIIDACLDKISALTTVIQGLRWIVNPEDVGTVRDHVGGEFPIASGDGTGGSITLID